MPSPQRPGHSAMSACDTQSPFPMETLCRDTVNNRNNPVPQCSQAISQGLPLRAGKGLLLCLSLFKSRGGEGVEQYQYFS